ncbi:MAG: C-GCAxxG-C-C family (seleno)protein [Lentisphaeria bacterium]
MAHRIDHALRAYHARTHNCAQSVLRAFQESHAVAECQIATAHGHGGGKAAAGRCGALHSALALTAAEPERQAQIRRQFQAATGSEACREIRRLKQKSCRDCVALAASLLIQTEKGDA